MHFIWRVFLIIIFLILELSFLAFLLPDYWVPNLVLSFLVCCLVISKDFKLLLVLSFLSGVLLDFFSGFLIGTSALAFLAILVLLKTIKVRLSPKPTFWQLLFLVSAAIFFYWIFISFGAYLGSLVHLNVFDLQFSWATLLVFAGRLISSLIFSTGLYFFLRRLEK